jgi:hypothetical protein
MWPRSGCGNQHRQSRLSPGAARSTSWRTWASTPT